MQALLLLAVLAFAGPAPVGPRGLPNAGASRAWAVAIDYYLRSPAGELSGSHPAIRAFKDLYPASDHGRRVLAPLVEQLQAAGYIPGRFASLDAATMRVVANSAAEQAARAVSAEAERLIASAADEDASYEALSLASQRLTETRDFYSAYLSPELNARVAQAQPKAAERLAGLLERGMQETVDALSSESAAAAAAQGLAQTLSQTSHAGKAKLLARKLEALSLKHPHDVETRLVAVRALVKDARSRHDHWSENHAARLTRSLARLAKDAPEAVQAEAVRGLLDGWQLDENLRSSVAVRAARKIAVDSRYESVKGLAVALAGRHPHLKELEEAVVKSAGGRAFLTVPKAPPPAALRDEAPKDPGLLRQLEEGVLRHPIAAFFAMWSVTWNGMTAFKLGFPVLGLAVFALGAAFAAARGLFKHHPWGVWFQLGLLGHFMETAATTGLGLPAFALATALWAAVAEFGFRKHQPFLAWALNVLLLSAFVGTALFTITIRLQS